MATRQPEWFQYKIMGEESAPLNAAQLKKLAQTGALQKDSLIRPVGHEDWIIADRIPWLWEREVHEVKLEPQPSAESPADPATILVFPVRRRRRWWHSFRPTLRTAVAGLACAALLAFVLGYSIASRRADSRPTAEQGVVQAADSGAKAVGGQPKTQTREQSAVTAKKLVSDKARLDALAVLTSCKANIAGDTEENLVHEVGFSGPKVTDDDLAALRQFPEIQVLSLEETNVSDEGLSRCLADLPCLKTLRLGGSKNISGSGLRYLQGSMQLRVLDLHATGITDASARQLLNVPALNVLDLSGTQLTDVALRYVEQLKSLKSLMLCSTKITESGMADLATMSSLELLDLRNVTITDRGVAPLARMTHLRELILENPQISAIGMNALRAALPKTRVAVVGRD